MDTGAKIKALRLKRRFTQKVLAEKVGVHRVYLNYIEMGTRAPSVHTLRRIAKVLGVDVADLAEERRTGESGMPTVGAVTEEMLHKSIYEELKRAASRGEMPTYSDIAPLAGLDMENPEDRDEIRRILSKISTYEHQHGRPLLTAIVVHKWDNIPGRGFFELAREIGAMKKGANDLAFFCNEVAKVHSAWRPKRN